MSFKNQKLKILSKNYKMIFNNNIYITDFPYTEKFNAVFPIGFESQYFVKKLKVKKDDQVLDLFTGSGILAIEAAKFSNRITAVDINPRAIEFASINAELNGVKDRIVFIVGNLFEPVKGLKFDVVLANPPFEIVPKGYNYYLHSNGGIKGIDIILHVIEEIHHCLNKNGTFQFVTFIPSDSNSIVEILNRKFIENDIELIKEIKAQNYIEYLSKNIKRINKRDLVPIKFKFKYINMVFVTSKGLKYE